MSISWYDFQRKENHRQYSNALYIFYCPLNDYGNFVLKVTKFSFKELIVKKMVVLIMNATKNLLHFWVAGES